MTVLNVDGALIIFEGITACSGAIRIGSISRRRTAKVFRLKELSVTSGRTERPAPESGGVSISTSGWWSCWTKSCRSSPSRVIGCGESRMARSNWLDPTALNICCQFRPSPGWRKGIVDEARNSRRIPGASASHRPAGPCRTCWSRTRSSAHASRCDSSTRWRLFPSGCCVPRLTGCTGSTWRRPTKSPNWVRHIRISARSRFPPNDEGPPDRTDQPLFALSKIVVSESSLS